MFRQAIATTAVLALFSVTPSLAQEATDYLDVPGPITLADTDYALSWSSNPQAGYFKQEYLPAGAVPERYQSMVMVEFLETDAPIADIARAAIPNPLHPPKADHSHG